MFCDYSILSTTPVPFFKRIQTEEVQMRLTRYSNCTPSRSNRKYLRIRFPSLFSLKNSYAFRTLPRHIQSMKKKLISDEWVGQKWLTVKEVCEYLGVSKSTFYKWRQMGCAPQSCRLPNGDLRIREDWLGMFMSELLEGGRS